MNRRHVALNVLERVVRDGAYANLALKKGLYGASRSDAAFVTALVYETIEHLSYAEYLLVHFASGRLSSGVRLILCMAITEIVFMNQKTYAVCNEYVQLARKTGKGQICNVVNAIIRKVERERCNLPKLPDSPEKRISIWYGIPEFLAVEYIERFGVEFTESMLSARLHKLTLRAVAPYMEQELVNELSSEGILAARGKIVGEAIIVDRGFEIESNPLYQQGKITLQGESSMLVCKACKAQRGSKVLDACAAPGGKSAYLAEIVGNDGRVVSWDVHAHRVELIKAMVKRLGISNISCAVKDASVIHQEFADSMDIVLVDAPCSGLGGGSKPDAYLNRTAQGVCEIAERQRAILNACAAYVKHNGALIYSTCTVSKKENEDNIDAFLKSHKNFELDDLSFCLPVEYNKRGEGGSIQLFPNLDGVDGFFIARMIRRS